MSIGGGNEQRATSHTATSLPSDNHTSKIPSNNHTSTMETVVESTDPHKKVTTTTFTSTSSTVTPISTTINNHRPWYRNGGMIINLVGIVINLIVPLVILCRVPNDPMKTQEQSQYFLRVLLGAWILAVLTTTRSKTTYCIFVVPTYMVSFIVLPMIVVPKGADMWYQIVRILFLSAVLASWKINICMSVCMHRYASHAAFKCGRYMNIGLCILSCIANQGGPLWWASQHRCHHKLRVTSTYLSCRVCVLVCIISSL
jgi:hypothetical protein